MLAFCRDLSAEDWEETSDSNLLQKLKALRRNLADEARLPAYMIFSDRSLVEMATTSPKNEREFLSINGVGEFKLAKYGPRFLELIRQHLSIAFRPSGRL